MFGGKLRLQATIYLPKRMTAGLLLRLPLPPRDSWTGHSAGSDKQPLCNKLLSLAAAVGTAPLSGRREDSVSSSTTAEFSTSAAWLSWQESTTVGGSVWLVFTAEIELWWWWSPDVGGGSDAATLLPGSGGVTGSADWWCPLLRGVLISLCLISVACRGILWRRVGGWTGGNVSHSTSEFLQNAKELL
jgi:hypothetical protein